MTELLSYVHPKMSWKCTHLLFYWTKRYGLWYDILASFKTPQWWICFLQTQVFTAQDVNWWTSGVDYCDVLSDVWTRSDGTHSLQRASIAETLMQWYISPNLMKKYILGGLGVSTFSFWDEQCRGKLLLKVMRYNIALLSKKVTNYVTVTFYGK